MNESNPNRIPFKRAAYDHLAMVGKALANGTRLEILELLAQAPRTVEVLAREVNQSVANTSQHLQSLKRAHLVTHRRKGLFVTYALAGDDVGALLATLQKVAAGHLAGLRELTRDYFGSRDSLEPLDRDTLLRRLETRDVLLIDVRPESEFAAGHVPGAVSVPLARLEEHLHALPRERTIVAYCRGPFCAMSADAARKLRALGFDARRAEISVTDFPNQTKATR